MRKMGGLLKYFQFLCLYSFRFSSLMGFPFLTDIIRKTDLRNRFLFISAIGLFAYIMGLFQLYLHQFIQSVLFVLTFINNPEVFVSHIQNAHDAPLLMAIPLIILFMAQFV